MKKSHLLSVIFSVGVLAPLANAAFSDVQISNDNYDAINFVQTQQIVQGYPDGTYKPEININRAEFTKLVINAAYSAPVIESCLQKETTPADPTAFFPDVPKTAWFAKFVCVAKINGIIAGYPDGSFQPSNPINFVEAAKIIANGFKYQTTANDIWYKPFVTALADKNAIPVTITSFEKLITRGEMAEMIYRIKAGIMSKESQTYVVIASGAASTGTGEVNTDLMLFFGKYKKDSTAESYPVNFRNCFTADSSCQTKQLYPDEWTLNTKDRLSFDTGRKRLIFPLEAGISQLDFFDIKTKTTTPIGLEKKYSASYQPSVSGHTLATTVLDPQTGETVIKFDLATNAEVPVNGFSTYDSCNWPVVSPDEKVWAVCTKNSQYKIVDENGVEINSSADAITSLAADTGNIYFVRNEEAWKISLSDDKVTALPIPAENKINTIAISPMGDYIGGKAQKSDKWLIFVFKPADNSFVVQDESDNEPGIPVFGPYID
jgi:hypothetical protein